MLSMSTMVAVSTHTGTLSAVDRPYHHGNLRAALLEAAEQALADGGTDTLSLRSLARQLGVSHAAPHRHFPDRQALLDALAVEGFMRLGAQMRAEMQRRRTFETRLAAFARAYVRFATAHPALLELMWASKHGREEVGEAADAAFAPPLELIAEGQASGDVIPGEPKEVAMLAFAAVHGLASIASAGLLGDLPVERLVDRAVAVVAKGLRP